MYNLTTFTLGDMTECGAVLRKLGSGAGSMEEVATKIVRYLYEHLLDRETGQSACALIRFFKTHALEGLDGELRDYAQGLLGDRPPTPRMPCLTLLATAGEQPAWNSRKQSRGHKAIPLASEKTVEAAPMVSNLLKQLGLEISMVVQPDPHLLLDVSQKTFNVFYVPEALGSPFIPAQQDFVIPYRIKSALGFGGVLPLGSLFAVILFSKVPLSLETAALFKPLALGVKMAVLPFEEAVFA